jgi:TRAP-type uncharacterized transport system substrate-binding protein
VLKTITGLSAIGLAGCTGADDIDDSENQITTVSLAHPGGSTINGQSAQALQRATRQESDSVNVITSEVSGNPAAVQAFDTGEVDGYATENYTIQLAAESRAQFAQEPVDNPAPQVFSHTVLHWYWMGVEGSGLETTDDVFDGDSSVWALPPAWGSRQFQEEVHKQAGVWDGMSDRVVDLEVGDVAGAIEEGLVEAIIAYGSGYQSIGGWATEVDARADLYMLETSDRLVEGVEAVGATNTEVLQPYGWEQDVGDEVLSWTLPSQVSISSDVSNEAVYEICRVSYEHNDVVREAIAAYYNHNENPQLMVSGLNPDLPIHEGAAKFYDDNDILIDDFEVMT